MHVDLQNVFTPAAAIEDSDRFAGRQEQLDDVSTALQSDGTQIIIYGNRGVGKSSLARQLSRLARGDQVLIERLSLPPFRRPDYLVISLECDNSVIDIKTLILRLLTDDTALAPWLPYRIEKRVVAGEVGGSLNVKILTLSGKGTNTTTVAPIELENDVYSVFANAVNEIIESGVAQSGILFIIDEVDRIKSRADLASFVRSRGADTRIKFALVGVSSTPSELIAEHESIVRQVSDGCIEMPPMSQAELRIIFENAHRILQNDGFTFTLAAQDWIIDLAKGHPYYVHLLGKHSLLRAATGGARVIDVETAQRALADIATKGTARIQEDAYQKAIGHSYIRELILKTFAQQDSEELYTTTVYQIIMSARQMDASTISVYVGSLGQEKYGAVLHRVRDRYYRFKDSLFKAYVAARPYHHRPDHVDNITDDGEDLFRSYAALDIRS